MSDITFSSLDIQTRIFTIRGVKVMLDRDLASLYGVTTKALNQSVRRNRTRFPDDFMFRLTKIEWDTLRSQSVTLEGKGRHPKYLPSAFTEHGIAMLSSTLSSDVAIAINLRIIRAFIALRHLVNEDAKYTTLQKTIRHIETRIDAIEATHLVDNTILATKVTELSRDVRRVSDTLDSFQDAHIVIKRPEDY